MSDYTADSIEVLSGLDPVRKRPGMYTDTSRPNHLAQEVVDNSIDEALAGHANNIEVTIHQDGSLSVSDNGRGMPVDTHPEYGVSGVELIMTRLHSGGKFSNKNYQYSGGLHGVGISVVNALSSKVEIAIKRNGIRYAIAFKDGEKSSDLQQVESIGVRNTGTSLRFWPDKKYFDTPSFLVSSLRHLLRAKAVLCSGLSIKLINEISGETEKWNYPDGLVDYLNQSLTHETLLKDPVRGSYKRENKELDWVVQWQSENRDLTTESYVNLIPTNQGGTHVNGFRNGLLEALKEYCELRKLLPRNLRLSADDVSYASSYLLSVKVPDPQFSGQTKEKLSSRETGVFVYNTVRDAFSIWLNTHSEEAEKLAEQVIDKAIARQKTSKQITRKKVNSGPALPGKLADCLLKQPEQCELFLVEGDSAGGSAKQARDKDFQAVMPLRGKIINSWELSHAQAMQSREVHDISVAIGVDPGSDDISGLRYHKICFLADADSDGQHIATLLCALFTQHFRPLVELGYVYVAMPPLYRIDIAKKVFYALDDIEKDHIIDSHKGNAAVQVTRFKGLGEMNPIQLQETTIAPATRKLLQLGIEDARKVTSSLDMLLAKKRSDDRKTWLEKRGNLAEII